MEPYEQDLWGDSAVTPSPPQNTSPGGQHSTLTPRIPPHDLDAESSVLSSMLFDREAIGAAYEILHGEDFYCPDNQAVFETIIEMFSRGIPVDMVTLSDKLAEKGVLEQIGGRERVVRLASDYFTSANIRQHAKIVLEKSTLRRLIKAAAGIVSSGYDAREEVDVILEHAEKSIFDIVQRRNTSDFFHINEVLVTALSKLEELSQQQGYITGVETGFTDLDKVTAGLQPSELILIGARPSMGKTAFMLNIAQHAAVRKNVPTAFFTLEMSKEQLVNRMLCAEAQVDATRLRTGRLEDREWIKIAESTGPLSRAPIYIDETPGIRFAEMRAKCRRLKIEKNLGIIVIDYLQLMTGSASKQASENRQLEISEISRSLKALAKELNIPVLTAAQLSRAVEARKDHRPMLSDLRESGAIEQDADVVAFLYRDEYYNKETLKKGQAEIIIAKQRNGPTTTVELMYLEKFTKFVNVYHGETGGIAPNAS